VGRIHTNGAIFFVSEDPTAAPTAAHGVNLAASAPLVKYTKHTGKNPSITTQGFLLLMYGGYGYEWLIGKCDLICTNNQFILKASYVVYRRLFSFVDFVVKLTKEYFLFFIPSNVLVISLHSQSSRLIR
jgi:hypothetical protein